MKLDEKDLAIIRELEKNSKQTNYKLSKKLNYPVTTIYNRVRKLVRNGVIQNFTVNLDWKKVGRPITSFIGVTIHRGKDHHMEVAKAIRRIEGVYAIYMMTGGSDYLVMVRAEDIDDLNDIITNKLNTIKGIDKTQTAIVLNQMNSF